MGIIVAHKEKETTQAAVPPVKSAIRETNDTVGVLSTTQWLMVASIIVSP